MTDTGAENTVSLEVEYDSDGQPTRAEYFHTTLGLVRFHIDDGVAECDDKWNRLSDKGLKDGYTRWTTTGDVFRSVQQLPFINEVRP